MLSITPEIESLIDRALAEDLGTGDPTTEALVPPDQQGRAALVAKADGVLAGAEVANMVFRRVDPALRFDALVSDGSVLEIGRVLAEVDGATASILNAERTALNFLRHLSGIATEASRYVEAVAGHRARILDTRKTTPGLRSLEKYAVRAGGGTNHRRSLGDGILIKDNHIKAMSQRGMDLVAVVKQARAHAPFTLKVEVEVEDLDQARQALDAGADILLLDNMDVDQMAKAVSMAKGRALTEASGRVTLETVRSVAATGVDLISVGAITHSAPVLDISLDLI